MKTSSFPPVANLESTRVLRELVQAHRYLAELKGVARTIPNQRILLSTLLLQEAQDSSAIENIITTQDALYQHRLQPESVSLATKEVARYASSLETGFLAVRESGLLTSNTIVAIQEQLEGNCAGFRKVAGTVLRNEQTGEVVFEPPSPEVVPDLMTELEVYLHEENAAVDSLIRMAVAHHQFETIHPFYDGNGRTGRIINILFLVKEGLLETPILYLSRYINRTQAQYYALLQQVREEQNWEPWLLYMLKGVAVTAMNTISLVEKIGQLLLTQKNVIRMRYKFYSQDLMNNLFRHPYTKVAFVQEDLQVSRATAARYLDALTKGGVLQKHKLGKENYYVNRSLVDLLFNVPGVNE